MHPRPRRALTLREAPGGPLMPRRSSHYFRGWDVIPLAEQYAPSGALAVVLHHRTTRSDRLIYLTRSGDLRSPGQDLPNLPSPFRTLVTLDGRPLSLLPEAADLFRQVAAEWQGVA